MKEKGNLKMTSKEICHSTSWIQTKETDFKKPDTIDSFYKDGF